MQNVPTVLNTLSHIPPDQLSSLHYLPLPLLDDSKTSYLAFKELYGKEFSDRDRPSATPTSSSEAAEVDAWHKPLTKNTKVRQVILGEECFKPRCIYAVPKLLQEEKIVMRLKPTLVAQFSSLQTHHSLIQ